MTAPARPLPCIVEGTVPPSVVARTLIELALDYRAGHPEIVAARESEAHQRACPTCSVGGTDGMCPEGRQREARRVALESEVAR